MPSVIYSMGVSLDGLISGPDGRFDFAAPDEELHRFHNEQARELGIHLCGRRLYETMVSWETVDEGSARGQVELEFARIWQQLPKLVFSTTLDRVEGNATLMRDGLVEQVEELSREGGRDIAVGGPGLASSLVRRGLIDEYRLFVSPVVLGGGNTFFPPLERPIELELLETRTFGSRVVYLRYRAR